MNYVLDVNVLLAWGWSDHVDPGRLPHSRPRGERRMTRALWNASLGPSEVEGQSDIGIRPK